MSTVTEACFEWTATGPSLASPSERCQLNFFLWKIGEGSLRAIIHLMWGVQLK